MIHLFHWFGKKHQLKKIPMTGTIEKQFDTGYDSIIALYEEWKEKSIRDNTYYLLGSSYFKHIIDEHYPPEFIRDFFIPKCMKVDNNEKRISLEVGELLEKYASSSTMRLGIHRSDSIIRDDIYTDTILHSILTEGLKNNGAAMQGLISTSPPDPCQAVRPASDMINACWMLKSSYRGSRGSLLVQLPKDAIDIDWSFNRGVDPLSIYEKKDNAYFIHPKYIIGYVETDGKCVFHTKEDLLENYKEKEI